MPSFFPQWLHYLKILPIVYVKRPVSPHLCRHLLLSLMLAILVGVKWWVSCCGFVCDSCQVPVGPLCVIASEKTHTWFLLTPDVEGPCKKGDCSEIKKGGNSLAFPCTGLEAVAVGEAQENITLHCGHVAGTRGLVTWYRNDSEPVFLLSSNSSLLPADPRFSLVNASSLHIEALSLQDEGNYTCWEVLNKTRWFQVWLQVASKWAGRALDWLVGCSEHETGGARRSQWPGFPSGPSHLYSDWPFAPVFPHLLNADKKNCCLIELLWWLDTRQPI